jgi:hypothetical protein
MSFTHEELQSFVGQKGDLPVGKDRNGHYNLTIRVIVRDAREAYGRVDLLVEPMYGTGTMWVSRHTVSLDAAELTAGGR